MSADAAAAAADAAAMTVAASANAKAVTNRLSAAATCAKSTMGESIDGCMEMLLLLLLHWKLPWPQ